MICFILLDSLLAIYKESVTQSLLSPLSLVEQATSFILYFGSRLRFPAESLDIVSHIQLVNASSNMRRQIWKKKTSFLPSSETVRGASTSWIIP